MVICSSNSNKRNSISYHMMLHPWCEIGHLHAPWVCAVKAKLLISQPEPILIWEVERRVSLCHGCFGMNHERFLMKLTEEDDLRVRRDVDGSSKGNLASDTFPIEPFSSNFPLEDKNKGRDGLIGVSALMLKMGTRRI